MKLIDLLVKELPKRGGWPEGAEYVRVTGFGGEKILVDFLFPEKYNKLSYSIGITACHLVDAGVDCQMIRRDSYEFALAASQKPAWNGEGVPPAGCECEYQYKVHGSEWCRFECVAVDGKAVFGWSNNTPVALQSNTHNFRPLRTEAERKRDEAISEIGKASQLISNNKEQIKHIAKHIYDAIAAGKIPGVKLED